MTSVIPPGCSRCLSCGRMYEGLGHCPFCSETDEPGRGRPGPKSVSVTLVPTEHKTNGAAPAMSPERRDALSGKDSPSGTDSRSQSGRTASPVDDPKEGA